MHGKLCGLIYCWLSIRTSMHNMWGFLQCSDLCWHLSWQSGDPHGECESHFGGHQYHLGDLEFHRPIQKKSTYTLSTIGSRFKATSDDMSWVWNLARSQYLHTTATCTVGIHTVCMVYACTVTVGQHRIHSMQKCTANVSHCKLHVHTTCTCAISKPFFQSLSSVHLSPDPASWSCAPCHCWPELSCTPHSLPVPSGHSGLSHSSDAARLAACSVYSVRVHVRGCRWNKCAALYRVCAWLHCNNVNMHAL